VLGLRGMKVGGRRLATWTVGRLEHQPLGRTRDDPDRFAGRDPQLFDALAHLDASAPIIADRDDRRLQLDNARFSRPDILRR
jgi:hypothetical protein